MHTRWLWPLVAGCALTSASCRPANGLYPVRGQVLFEGKPAAGATVWFLRKGATDPYQESTPQGVVQEDGSFTLAGPSGAGAAPGEYVVLVEWKEGAEKKRGRSPGLNAPDRLKGRYLNPRQPLLTATVASANNALPAFELK
jgi:hypothetical protein